MNGASGRQSTYLDIEVVRIYLSVGELEFLRKHDVCGLATSTRDLTLNAETSSCVHGKVDVT